MKSVDSSTDNEVLRVIKAMPNWKPGKQNGQPVKTFYTLPVSFKFQGQAGDTIADARDYLITKPAPPPAAPLPDKVFTSVEIMPEYPGGMKALLDFLNDNVRCPQVAKDKNIHGRVVLRFVVDKDGSIVDVEIKQNLGGGCGEEAVRVVKSMPKWKPGIKDGKPVKVYYTLPFTFSLGKKEK